MFPQSPEKENLRKGGDQRKIVILVSYLVVDNHMVVEKLIRTIWRISYLVVGWTQYLALFILPS